MLSIVLRKRNKLKTLNVRPEGDNTGAMLMTYGIVNGRFVSGHNRVYEEKENTEQESLKNKVFKFFNKGHTIFTNDFRSVIYGDKKGYEPEGIPYVRHLSYQDDVKMNDFMYQLAWNQYYAHEPRIKTESNNNKLTLKSIDMDNVKKISIAAIPDDIMNLVKINDIKRLSKILKLNKTSGFYEYIDENNVAFPLVCRHMFMYLSGDSMFDISIECVKNGKCIYCGQEMTNYSEHLVNDIASFVTSVIYQFFELLPVSFNMTSMYYATIEYLTKLFERNNIIADDKQLLFTYLFYYGYIKYEVRRVNEIEDKIDAEERSKVVSDTVKKVSTNEIKIDSKPVNGQTNGQTDGQTINISELDGLKDNGDILNQSLFGGKQEHTFQDDMFDDDRYEQDQISEFLDNCMKLSGGSNEDVSSNTDEDSANELDGGYDDSLKAEGGYHVRMSQNFSDTNTLGTQLRTSVLNNKIDQLNLAKVGYIRARDLISDGDLINKHHVIRFRPLTMAYKRFMLNCSSIANANGLTINELNSFKLVDNYDAYTNLLIASMYNNSINYYELIPVSLLFNTVNYTDFSKFVAKTEFQKLFMNGKMKEFNDQVDILIKSVFKMQLPVQPAKTLFSLTSFPEYKQSGTLAVFLKIIKYYCPVNIIHVFEKGSSVCKFCKYNKDKNNAMDVYDNVKMPTSAQKMRFITVEDNSKQTIDVSGLKPSDFIATINKSKIYGLILEKVCKDPEFDRMVLSNIYGFDVGELDSTKAKVYYSKYAHETSPEELEWKLRYYYNIGIATPEMSLINIDFDSEFMNDMGQLDDNDSAFNPNIVYIKGKKERFKNIEDYDRVVT